jgi:hypothetical protein
MNRFNTSRKSALLGGIAVAAILASAVWIYRTQLAPSRDVNRRLHKGVGEALGLETVKLLPGPGEIVLVTMQKGSFAEMDLMEEAFKRVLYKSRLRIARVDRISAEKSAKFGPGSGMSGKRFAKLAEKYPKANAIVSLVGVPDPDDKEMKSLSKSRPNLVAFSRSTDDLEELFERNFIQVAIVPRFEFPAPGPEEPKTKEEWFQRHFQVVISAAMAAKAK